MHSARRALSLDQGTRGGGAHSSDAKSAEATMQPTPMHALGGSWTRRPSVAVLHGNSSTTHGSGASTERGSLSRATSSARGSVGIGVCSGSWSSEAKQMEDKVFSLQQALSTLRSSSSVTALQTASPSHAGSGPSSTKSSDAHHGSFARKMSNASIGGSAAAAAATAAASAAASSSATAAAASPRPGTTSGLVLSTVVTSSLPHRAIPSALDARARDSEQAFAAYASVAASLNQDQQYTQSLFQHQYGVPSSERASGDEAAQLHLYSPPQPPRRTGDQPIVPALHLPSSSVAASSSRASESRQRRRVPRAENQLASPTALAGSSNASPISPANTPGNGAPPMHTPRRPRGAQPSAANDAVSQSPPPALPASHTPMTPAELIAHYGGGGHSSSSADLPSARSLSVSVTPSPRPLHHSASATSTPAAAAEPKPSMVGALTTPRQLVTPRTQQALSVPGNASPASNSPSPRAGLRSPASSSALLLSPTGSNGLSPTAASPINLSSSPSFTAPGSASVFHATAPSSFVESQFDPVVFYTSRCAAHGIAPNSVLLQMFQQGLAPRRVWDCGYLYLGHRGVLPLLDTLAAGGSHVEELSLRGTGMRNGELVKLIEIVRRGIVHAAQHPATTPVGAATTPPPNGEHCGPRALRTLDLADNPLSDSGGAQLLLLVNLSPSLTRVHLDGTRIDEVSARAITSACLAKLAARPSVSKLTASTRRYASFAAHGGGSGKSTGSDDAASRMLEQWKNKLLEGFARKDVLADIAAGEAEEAKNNLEAAARERDRQTVRLLLRCLQTDNDVVGLLLRFDETRHPEVWRDVRIIRRFVKRLIETGHHRKAFELADRFVHPQPAKSGPAPPQPVVSGTGVTPNDAAVAAKEAAAAAAVAATSPVAPVVAQYPPVDFRNDEILQWWRVYALARSRNFTDAFKEINLLLESPALSLAPTIQANLLGLAAMLRKCMYESGARADLDSIESALQEEDANESANLYLKSYETAQGLMEGVAAATMMRLANKDEESAKLAKKMLKQATSELALLERGIRGSKTSGGGGGGGAGGFDETERKLNLYSVLAEANINLERPNAAYKFYQAAVAIAGSNVNHLSQLQQNLQLLSQKRVRIGEVMHLFHAGNVCVFTGLAVDHPLHDIYAFPPERDLELELSYQLELQLDLHQIQIGFVSLSCGAEILFAEKMLERKCELHVVLPFALDDFFTSSIDYGLASMYRWHGRAQSILKRCETHYTTSERFLGDGGLFAFQDVIMEGLALIRSRELGVGAPIAIAVLDSHQVFAQCRPNRFIRLWRAKKATVGVIDLQDVRRRVLSLPSAGSAQIGAKEPGGGHGGTNYPSNAPRGTLAHRFSEANPNAGGESKADKSSAAATAAESHAPSTDVDSMFTAKPPSSDSTAVVRRTRASPLHGPDATGGAATMQHTLSSTGKFLTAMQFASKITRVVKYMMFADIESSQTMSESLTPIFFKTFFKLLEKARKESRVSPFYANTWGSGLYFIFHTVDQCAEFSLHLLQVVAKMDWASLGLPPATACLGMHGGPLFPGYNPVEEKDFFFGAHVCRAARIKAVTPAGHAYASEQFVAALAVADGERKRFFFEYLGHRDLAKSYDRCPLYRLCRMEDVRKHAVIRGVITSPTAEVDSPVKSGPSASDMLSPHDTPATQAKRIRERRQKDRKGVGAAAAPSSSPSSALSPGSGATPFSPSDLGLLHSGPLSSLTIERATPFFVSRLVEHYLSLDPTSDGLMYWEDVTLLHALVSRLIALGQTHVAFLVVQKALAYDSAYKNDLRLKYYRVLALRHTQKAEEFMRELKEVMASHPRPAQIPLELRASVLSLSGRMLKDKYYESVRNHEPNQSFAHESAREYFFSYELVKSSFPAINAATMLLLSKQKERARALAKFSVRLVADELLARSKQHWNLSSQSTTLASQALESASGFGGAFHNHSAAATNAGQEAKDPQTQSLVSSLSSAASTVRVYGDGTEIDEKLSAEEREKAARGEAPGKGSEKAAGEGSKPGREIGEEYWLYAAMGEAYLVLDEPEKCTSWYRHALEKAQGHMGSISTMYRNFLLLQSAMKVPQELHELFLASLGRVLVCAAHPLIPWTGPYKKPKDEPVTPTPAAAATTGAQRIEEGEEESEEPLSRARSIKRLNVQIPSPRPVGANGQLSSPPPLSSLTPQQRYFRLLEERVVAEIRLHISTARPTVAFVFLLTDTDLLFAECLMERGVEVHVLLVYTKSIFLQRCVEHGFERLHNWQQRLDVVFKRTILHFVTRDKQATQKQLLYHFNRRVLQGLTILRAQQLDCGNPLALCVLDGLDAQGNPIPESDPFPPAAGSRSFPPLDRSSAGLDFPNQWCAFDAEHTCTIVNLAAIRLIAHSENEAWDRRRANEVKQTREVLLQGLVPLKPSPPPPRSLPHTRGSGIQAAAAEPTSASSGGSISSSAASSMPVSTAVSPAQTTRTLAIAAVSATSPASTIAPAAQRGPVATVAAPLVDPLFPILGPAKSLKRSSSAESLVKLPSINRRGSMLPSTATDGSEAVPAQPKKLELPLLTVAPAASTEEQKAEIVQLASSQPVPVSVTPAAPMLSLPVPRSGSSVVSRRHLQHTLSSLPMIPQSPMPPMPNASSTVPDGRRVSQIDFPTLSRLGSPEPPKMANAASKQQEAAAVDDASPTIDVRISSIVSSSPVSESTLVLDPNLSARDVSIVSGSPSSALSSVTSVLTSTSADDTVSPAAAASRFDFARQGRVSSGFDGGTSNDSTAHASPISSDLEDLLSFPSTSPPPQQQAPATSSSATLADFGLSPIITAQTNTTTAPQTPREEMAPEVRAFMSASASQPSLIAQQQRATEVLKQMRLSHQSLAGTPELRSSPLTGGASGSLEQWSSKDAPPNLILGPTAAAAAATIPSSVSFSVGGTTGNSPRTSLVGGISPHKAVSPRTSLGGGGNAISPRSSHTDSDSSSIHSPAASKPPVHSSRGRVGTFRPRGSDAGMAAPLDRIVSQEPGSVSAIALGSSKHSSGEEQPTSESGVIRLTEITSSAHASNRTSPHQFLSLTPLDSEPVSPNPAAGAAAGASGVSHTFLPSPVVALVATAPPMHRRHRSRQPSICDLADIMMAPKLAPPAAGSSSLRVSDEVVLGQKAAVSAPFVESGLQGVFVEQDEDAEESMQHQAVAEADAISKAVDATYSTPAPAPRTPVRIMRRAGSVIAVSGHHPDLERFASSTQRSRSRVTGGIHNGNFHRASSILPASHSPGRSTAHPSSPNVEASSSPGDTSPAPPAPPTIKRVTSIVAAAAVAGSSASSEDYYRQRAETVAANMASSATEIFAEKEQADAAAAAAASAATPTAAEVQTPAADADSVPPLPSETATAPAVAATAADASSKPSAPSRQGSRVRFQRQGHRKTSSTPLNMSQIRSILAVMPPNDSPKEGDSTSPPKATAALVGTGVPTPEQPSSPTAVAAGGDKQESHPSQSEAGAVAAGATRSSGSRASSRPNSPPRSRVQTARARRNPADRLSRQPSRSHSPAPPSPKPGPVSMPFRGGGSHGAANARMGPQGPSFIGPTLTEASYSRAVRFIIFADVRNYSKLSQEQTPLFCTHFLNIVRQVIDLFLEQPHIAAATAPGAPPPPPSLQFWNTWGDGLFVVFADPVQCSRFALVLLQKVHQTRWAMYGLPSELTMRVGMHAGPVLVGWDPVVRHDNFFGPHVLYAQLIEPITTPGCAFATAQFAACLATSPEAVEFKLEYIGSSVLEKEFADADYAELSAKEKQDYARCHLYNLTENKSFSAARIPAAQGTPLLGSISAAAAAVAAGGTPALSRAGSYAGGAAAAAASTSGSFMLGDGISDGGVAGAAVGGSHVAGVFSTRPALSRTSSRALRPSAAASGSATPSLVAASPASSSAAAAAGAGSAASGASASPSLSSSALISPSVTYSLLKFEELKTERANQAQALEILQNTKLQEAAAAAAALSKQQPHSHSGAVGAPATGKRSSSKRSSGGAGVPFASDLLSVSRVGSSMGMTAVAASSSTAEMAAASVAAASAVLATPSAAPMQASLMRFLSGSRNDNTADRK